MNKTSLVEHEHIVDHDEVRKMLRAVLSSDPSRYLGSCGSESQHVEVSSVLTQKATKYQEVLEVAEALHRQSPDWVTFFREVLGADGAVRKAFPTFDELTAFEQSPQFGNIQKLLVRLREKRCSTDDETEPTRVITIRLPKSMHEYLRTEAHDLRTSMNKLCISKLLQVVGEDMIPQERTESARASTSQKTTKKEEIKRVDSAHTPLRRVMSILRLRPK